MGGQRQWQVFGLYAATVVGHADQRLAGIDQLHVNACGTGVDGVFDQFLDHAGRAFHHLAGGDLVGEFDWQHGNPTHGCTVSGPATCGAL
jgi:hypothetical protein